jgi:hypothetical protein
MHKQIYQHPVINQIDFMILDILNEVDEEFGISANITDIDKFVSYTDCLIDRIKYTTTNINAKTILSRIDTRDLYQFAGEIIFDGKNEDVLQQIEGFKNIVGQKELVQDVILTKFNINFNLKNKNPVDEIYF